jgi:hypothetical protein
VAQGDAIAAPSRFPEFFTNDWPMTTERGPRLCYYSPAATLFKDAEWSMIISAEGFEEFGVLYRTATFKLFQEYAQLQTQKTRVVKAHSRSLYPGGPSVNVPRHDARYMTGPSLPGRTLPGRPMWLRYRPDLADWNPLTNNPDAKELQFTLVGRYSKFYQEVSALAKISHVVVSPYGNAKPMPKAVIPIP